MKKSKLLAILSAIIMTSIASLPVISSAINVHFEYKSPKVQEILEDYEPINDQGLLAYYGFEEDYQAYVKKDSEFTEFYLVKQVGNKVYLQELGIIGGNPLTRYPKWSENYYYDDLDAEIERVQNYIDDNNMNCEVLKTDIENWDLGGYTIYPNYEITPEEHFELAIKLKNELGIIPFISGMQSDFTIELESVIAGDVNLDGTVDVADVVAISAYTGDAENNSFKSEQQIINGDVHNTGDGLTANDALMIQQYLAGMIDSLE